MTHVELSILSLYDRSVRLNDFFDSPSLWRFSLQARSVDRKKIEEIQKLCELNTINIVYPGHSDYPCEFLSLHQPPLFITYIGRPVWQTRACFAVVGSREPQRRTLEWLDLHLSDALIECRKFSLPLAVVSGGARGIDQRAHRLANSAETPTIVFLPSGILNPYPSEMESWKAAVLESGGAMVSLRAPEESVRPSFFEARNELIAAVSKLVFVAEARRRSGSSMTGRLARELDRSVWYAAEFSE
jgi:DNA processing protein